MTRPKEDPADYVLEEVVDLPTKHYTRQQNAGAWKALLSAEDYVIREHVLGKARITSSKANRLHVFALRARAAPEPLCSCEILIRESQRFHREADGLVSRKSILSGCIGGVYTYEGNRGRGLAAIMIDKLMEYLRRPDFVGPDGFTFLYSEVGEFYTRNGFKSFGVPLMNFPLTPLAKPYAPPAGVELVKYHEFADLFNTYRDRFAAQMRARVAADGKDRVAIVPTADIVDWFHLRVKYFGVKLFGDSSAIDFEHAPYDELVRQLSATEPAYFGLKLVSLAGTDFIVWQYEYGFSKERNGFENYATVIKISAGDDRTALRLLALMKEYLEAKHPVPQMQNFTKIVVWELEVSPAVVKQVLAQYGGVHGLDNGLRSAILFNNAADDAKVRLGEIVWEENTKLPWF